MIIKSLLQGFFDIKNRPLLRSVFVLRNINQFFRTYLPSRLEARIGNGYRDF